MPALFDLPPVAEPAEVHADPEPEPEPAVFSAPGLAAQDLAMLRLAGQHWRNGSAKDQAIRDRFGISPTRFHQRVNALLADPAALAAEPLILRRLQRIKAARAAMRGHRTGGARRGR